MVDLNNEIRELMLNEILFDVSRKTFFYSPKFNNNGRNIYLSCLKEACAAGDEETLWASLESSDTFNKYEAFGKRVDAREARNFSQNEFNKYYIRALCVKAIELNKQKLEVYRAVPAKGKSPKVDLMIGSLLEPDKLLKDLRQNTGVLPAMLPGLSAGLSIKFQPA
ncbi:MAG TPA: hypothetical protein VN721_01360 [Flavipsychrobacter sp.]|nr:hypothetical protein [Flavipsychrobacter sp.]